MSDFFSKLRKVVIQIDKFTEELDDDKESSQEPRKEHPDPSTGIDLRQYLPIDEVALITNLPIDTYNKYMDNDWEGGVYSSSESNTHTYFQAWFARKDTDGYHPNNVWSYLTSIIPNLQKVPGIGEEARTSTDEICQYIEDTNYKSSVFQ